MTYKPVPYVIGEVVAEVAKKFTVYYDYGTTLEVVNRLSVKSESSQFFDKKYPLIWMLIGDNIKEEIDYNKAIKRKAIGVSIIICSQTKREYSSKERYEHLFIPVLRPLYDEFIKQLKLNKSIGSENKYNHTYYENLFWGRNGLYGREGNIFNDMIDAIVIDDLDLLVLQNC